MPGLSLNMDGTGIPQTPVPVPVPNIAGYTPPAPPTGAPSSSSSSTAASAGASSSAAAVPANRPPAPLPRAITTSHPPTIASRAAPAPPAAGAAPPPAAPRAPAAPATPAPAPAGPSAARPSSPTRPPVSPITPPLNPVSFPPPRQSHAHSSHPPQASALPPPPPEPIEFDTNPDVLALKSAISVLQMQSKKAKRDMVALQQAKMAALDNTEAFVTDLANGYVHMEGAGPCAPSSSSSDDDDDDDKSDARPPKRDAQSADNTMEPINTAAAGASSHAPRPWSSLPAAQNIYRCPPINWSQYAVAGDSLDKLHREQQGRPAQGVPATLTPDGRYEFKGVGKQEEFVGVAAPYNPFKDALNKRKSKGPNR